MSLPTAGVEVSPVRTYRFIANNLLIVLAKEVQNPSVPFPVRKAVFENIISMTKSLLYHIDKPKHIEAKVGKSVATIINELDRKPGEDVDTWMERVIPLIRDVLSEIAILEATIYPEASMNWW